MSKTYYIAGPMRGRYKFNFPLFDEVRDKVLAMGFLAISPADIDRANGMTEELLPTNKKEEEVFMKRVNVREVARRDVIAIIDHCDGIIMLPEWSESAGAKAEYALAQWLGLEIAFYDNGTFVKENPEIEIWKQSAKTLLGKR